MALPFYNQGDQDIYAGGDHFIPQQQYRLNYTPSQSLASTIGNTGGVTGAQAANPYISPQGGGGGGGGGFPSTNKFGLDMSTQKTITVGMANADGVYQPTKINIAKSPGGLWKNVDTNQNAYHGNIGVKGLIGTVMSKMMGKKTIPGITEEGTTTGAEWDEEFDPTIAGRKLTTIQRWKAKKEFKKEQEKAAADKAAADAAVVNKQKWQQDYAGWQSPSGRDHEKTGGIGSKESKAGGAPGTKEASADWRAQGGRIGFKDGLSAYQLFKLKELGYGNAGSNPGSYGGLGVLRDILKLHKYKQGGRIGMAKGKIPLPKVKTKMGFLDKLFMGIGGLSPFTGRAALHQSMSKATESGRAAKAAQRANMIAKYGKGAMRVGRFAGLMNPWTAAPIALLAGAQYGVGKAFDPYRDETGKIGAEGHAQLASAARAREALMAQRNAARENRRDGGLAGLL